MFGSLKEKLKNWIKKSSEKNTLEKTPKKEIIKKEKSKKTPKKSSKKIKKEEKKIKEEILEDEIIENTQTIEEKSKEKKSFFGVFKRFLTEEKFEELFKGLELILLQNNVAYEAVQAVRDELSNNLIGKNIKEIDLAEELKKGIGSILINPPNFIDEIKGSLEVKSPFVILVCGINGSGKTTTIAKLANYLQKNSLSVCLAAADTFRAASIEQIEVHATNLKIPLIKKDYGSDPASVGFEGITYAKKNSIDVVLIDTAGRMQNSASLMREIEKIVKVTKPDMKIYLGESITGNDAIEQAKTFNDSINLTGIILSKADVDEKGGTAISVALVTKKPILFLGTGQNYEDLEIFDKDKLIEKLGL
ncbi:MAG: signal recognition particle-docking protein FtsY [Nanoarchaeota archaeon]|nr:signal recognition particle-docking protein FtsY [Nanoarchaeota archaeon]